MPLTDTLSLAAKVLHSPTRAAGGFSGETFAGMWFHQAAFVRMYRRDPHRAVIDLALMRRLSPVLPLPKVLAAEPRGLPGVPPHIVTAAVEGDRADRLLDRGLPLPAANALGRQCARLISLLRSVHFDGYGPFRDADLRVGAWPDHQGRLQAWYEHLEPDLAAAGLGRRSVPGLRHLVLSASQRLAGREEMTATLVHGDLNGKNLIVNPDTGRLRAVLDWEFAHAGDWAEDVGNLLRAADQGSSCGGEGAASWTAFRRGLVDALHAGLHENGSAAGVLVVDDDWMHRADDLDLFSLLELAARSEHGAAAPVPVALAREALRARVQSQQLR